MLMLVLENLNMEILVLLAGILGDTNVLAAQVILVSIGQFTIMVPYGFALGAVSMIGHSLGAN
jgi:Na+-driven multidrug efflux pump